MIKWLNFGEGGGLLMNEEGNISNYTWELVGIDNITQERLSFSCPAKSIGPIINQIVKEEADGLWEIPEGVSEGLKKIIVKGIISIELISNILNVDRKWVENFISDEDLEFKLAADNVIILMELIRKLS